MKTTEPEAGARNDFQDVRSREIRGNYHQTVSVRIVEGETN